MKFTRRHAFIVAGILSLLAALSHVAVILGGPSWYRAFGAGEQLANMAAQGHIYPTLLTLCIAGVLTLWGLYAFSAAKILPRLPLLRTCLCAITVVYCIRGIYGFFIPVFVHTPYVQTMGIAFWAISSSICLIIGGTYLVGLILNWKALTDSPSGHKKL